MFLKNLRDIARPQWFRIIIAIKRSTGLSVPELAKELKMSYMGIKKHCVALEKLKYLDTWRRPKEVGRPEKLYRLTEKANALFPGVGDDLTLSLLASADQIDPNAAEKLLFGYFQQRTESYLKKAKGQSIADRAASLAKLREQDGYLSECRYNREGGLQIVEYHNPLQAIFDKYPTVERMEEHLFEKVLSAGVSRTVEQASGLRRFVYAIRTL